MPASRWRRLLKLKEFYAIQHSVVTVSDLILLVTARLDSFFCFMFFFVSFVNFWRIIQKCAGKSISKVN